jgi:hypothetical protein
MDCMTSDDSAKSFYFDTSSGRGECVPCTTSLTSCLLCSDSSTCVVRDSKTLAASVACDDSNCRVCETDNAVCDYCMAGYVNTVGVCASKYYFILYLIGETCTVANCMDCTDSGVTTCDV